MRDYVTGVVEQRFGGSTMIQITRLVGVCFCVEDELEKWDQLALAVRRGQPQSKKHNAGILSKVKHEKDAVSCQDPHLLCGVIRHFRELYNGIGICSLQLFVNPGITYKEIAKLNSSRSFCPFIIYLGNILGILWISL